MQVYDKATYSLSETTGVVIDREDKKISTKYFFLDVRIRLW